MADDTEGVSKGPDEGVEEGVDERVTSVPLPTDDGEDRVIAQQNAGPDTEGGGGEGGGGEGGGGEWPSPQAPPTGPAPGTTPEGAEAASRRDQAPPQKPAPTTATQAGRQQDAGEGGDRGPARSGAPPASFDQALRADPVAGGSQSVPDDDDPVDPSPG